MKKWTIASLAVAIAATAMIGANVLADAKDDGKLLDVRPAVETVTETAITLEDAKQIALNQVDNGVVTEAEMERERGEIVYEFEVKTNEFEYEFKINGDGRIFKEEHDRDDDVHQAKSSLIRSEEAKKFALNEVTGTVDEIELEREDGRYVYEVEIEREREGDDDDVTVYIDAVTGNVLYVE